MQRPRAFLRALTLAAPLTALGTSPASGLSLVDETLIVDSFLLEQEILATDSEIRVVEGGGFEVSASVRIELHGDSLYDQDTSGEAGFLGHLSAFDDSRVVLRNGSFADRGSVVELFDRTQLEMHTGWAELNLFFRGSSSALIAEGGFTGGGGGGGVTVSDQATLRMTGGILSNVFALSFGGERVEISGGQVTQTGLVPGASFDADLAIISGGLWTFSEFVSGADWTIGPGQVEVHGSGLTIENGRLTGFLADGHPIDVSLAGNVQNVTLVPEPGTGWLVGLGLLVLGLQGRQRPGPGSRATAATAGSAVVGARREADVSSGPRGS